jgi:hypothetical protein
LRHYRRADSQRHPEQGFVGKNWHVLEELSDACREYSLKLPPR